MHAIMLPQHSANGVVGAKYSFDESYDGGSCLRFTGVLNEKVTATLPLFRYSFEACFGGEQGYRVGILM